MDQDAIITDEAYDKGHTFIYAWWSDGRVTRFRPNPSEDRGFSPPHEPVIPPVQWNAEQFWMLCPNKYGSPRYEDVVKQSGG